MYKSEKGFLYNVCFYIEFNWLIIYQFTFNTIKFFLICILTVKKKLYKYKKKKKKK